MKQEDLQKPVKESVREVKSLLFIHQTVDEAITHIRNTHSIDKSVVYFYVIDERGKLLGVIGTRDLLTSAPETPIAHLIHTKVKTVQANHTMYDALMLMQKFHLLALPVVEHGKLIGILDIQNYFEEAINLDTTKRRQEVFQTLGIMLEDGGVRMSTGKKYLMRAPWMFCNMFGGLACAVISEIYKVVLLKVIVLAMFIPLVLSLSESISMQSMTQSLYEVKKHFHFKSQAFRYILHEAKLFVLIAMTCGVLVGAISLLWGDGVGPGIVIGLSILISIIVSATIGALIPLVLHTWKLDPKIASGPIVLMAVDIITTTIYLSIAFRWFL